MVILIITAAPFSSTYGGGEVYVKNQVDELIQQGIFPVIASPGDGTPISEGYKGCAVYTFEATAGQKDFKVLYPLLDKIKPGIVHAHGFKASFALACKNKNIPCIITAHHGGIVCPAGTLLNYKDQICHIKANPADCLPCVLRNTRGGLLSWPLLKMLPLPARLFVGKVVQKLPFIYYITPTTQASQTIREKLVDWKAVYENASLIIAPSFAIANSMKLNNAPANKIIVLPHGIPISGNKIDNEKKLWIKGKPIKFFYVGRISYVKGVHVMLAAFNQIQPGAELHIIGGAGNNTERRYMEQLRKEYSANDTITWHGKLQPGEINGLIAQFDVMVHPAIFLEVYGLSIAEALAMGKPVLATRCGGAEMQIEEGRNGWLVEPNSVSALRKAVQKVIDHPESIPNNQNEISSHVVNIEDHIKKLIGLYNEYKN
jgi:glycosyltransferase involved in cell wall biosynthesis